jgi:gluconate 2-dehydrogenase gamma chain
MIERPMTLSRRALVRSLFAGSGAAALSALLWQARERSLRAPSPGDALAALGRLPSPARRLTAEERATLAAAQERLLPSEPQSPGAREVHAIDFLAAALADLRTDPADVELVLDGIEDLDALAQEKRGERFAALDAAAQDEVLRAHQEDQDDGGGAEWMGVLLAFTLEALLGDPVYGGNPGGAGWKWLAIPEPFPRPAKPFATEPV